MTDNTRARELLAWLDAEVEGAVMSPDKRQHLATAAMLIRALASPQDVGVERTATFKERYTAERKFVNSAGNEIEIYVSTGATEKTFCRLTMSGPKSGCENYTTWDELIQLHSALTEALFPLASSPAAQPVDEGNYILYSLAEIG